MKSDSVARRLLLAAFLAASLIGLTYFATRSSAASRIDGDPDTGTPRVPSAPDDVSAVLAGPGTLVLYVAARAVDVPLPVAPVVAVAEGGGLHVVRQPPEPEGGPWLAAGIVLPETRLADLDAGGRAGLLEILGAFAGGRRLAPRDIVLRGIEASDDEVAVLLRWVR